MQANTVMDTADVADELGRSELALRRAGEGLRLCRTWFGYGFFPGAVALVTWAAATSVSRYRAVAAAVPAGAQV